MKKLYIAPVNARRMDLEDIVMKIKKKPLQFHVPEEMHVSVERLAAKRGITVTELLKQSVRIFLLLSNYADLGYRIVLRNDKGPEEKEILVI